MSLEENHYNGNMHTRFCIQYTTITIEDLFEWYYTLITYYTH